MLKEISMFQVRWKLDTSNLHVTEDACYFELLSYTNLIEDNNNNKVKESKKTIEICEI